MRSFRREQSSYPWIMPAFVLVSHLMCCTICAFCTHSGDSRHTMLTNTPEYASTLAKWLSPINHSLLTAHLQAPPCCSVPPWSACVLRFDWAAPAASALLCLPASRTRTASFGLPKYNRRSMAAASASTLRSCNAAGIKPLRRTMQHAKTAEAC